MLVFYPLAASDVVFAQQLSTLVTSLRYSSILRLVEFGRRLVSQAEFGGST